MAYIDKYPNGFKDGYSSADDPGIDKAEERASNAKFFAEESKRRERETIRKLQEEQKQREAIYQRQIELQHEEEREQEIQRKLAVNLMVSQKRDEYNKKSWFGKAFATLRGKSFDKMKKQITEEAQKRVSKMSMERVEQYIEKQVEKEGRHR